MFTHMIIGTLACRRYAPELSGKFALLPVYFYTDVNSFRASLPADLPALLSSPISSLFYTQLQALLPAVVSLSLIHI